MTDALPVNDRYAARALAAGQTDLPYDFELLAESDLTVILERAGVQTTLIEGVDFIFPLGLGDASGGTAQLVVAAQDGDVYYLVGLEAIDRVSEFSASLGFDTDKLDADVDKLTRIAQEARRDIDRALKPAFGEAGQTLPTPAADQFVGWNSVGDALENKDMQNLGTVQVIDEDDMASDSDTKVPTQQSVKAYADTKQPLLQAGDITNGLLNDGSVTDNKVNASGIGAAKSNFTPTGTAGEVATRSVIQVLEDYSNSIVNYNDGNGNTPVADGATDVSTAVTRALASNRAVFIPPSAAGFAINALITLDAGQSVIGVPGRSKINHGGAADLFSIASDDVSISGLSIDAANNAGGYTFAVDTTATRQRLTIENNYIVNAKGGIKDANDAGQLITLDLKRTRWRYHQGPGVSFYDAFAFINLDDVYVDYLNNPSAQNFTAYFFSGNQGLNLRNVEVSGSIGSIAGTTTAQKGLDLQSCQAVKVWRFFGDNLGGAGMSIDSGAYMEFDGCSLSLADNGQLVMTNSNTEIGFSNCYFGGRRGLGTAAASKDNINLSAGTAITDFTGCRSINATGNGINNAGTSAINWTGGTLYDNVGRGVKTVAGSSLHVNGANLIANAAGNYDLASSLDQLTAARLNSGGIFTGAGPITG